MSESQNTSVTCDSAFNLISSTPVESLNIVIHHFQHQKTGAVHYHIASEHDEKVFLVAVRTMPHDSTGVAHILEHTALCGSEKYPVRDPFFMMTRRSLNTFMNAMTSSDWTAYPFASQNDKDFDNLLDVYLDAVFFARLHELDFAQEGHRVELKDPEDPDSPLEFKGVVFNEMKGAMSSPVSQLWQGISGALFPTTTYHYNSGGEPEAIVDLTYEQLKSFYKTHYHPSNAIFMTFGDLDVADLQHRIDVQALDRFEKQDKEWRVDPEQRFSEPQVCEASYGVDGDDLSGKTHHVVGWLLGDSVDLDAQLEAHLVSDVLLDNSASPLRHALESTELGSTPSPLCGLEDSNREMSFMCGVEGSEPEHAAAVEQLILTTLQKVAEEGVPQSMVEASLHQLELHQREIGGDHYPYGLQLIMNALPAATHHGDPVALLNLDPALARLREKASKPGFMQEAVQRLLLSNMHRVRYTLKPDAGLNAEKAAHEQQVLADMRAAMTAEDVAAVKAQAVALEERQALQDDPDLLPQVTLADVTPEMSYVAPTAQHAQGLASTEYVTGTNGIVYQQLLLDLPQMTAEQLTWLPFFTQCWTEVGAAGHDYMTQQQRQTAVLGSLSSYVSIKGTVEDCNNMSGYLVMTGKALAGQSQEFSDIIKETWQSADFKEEKRISDLLGQAKARKEQGITGGGHSLAMSLAAAPLNQSAALQNELGGLPQAARLKARVAQLKSEGAGALCDALDSIFATVAEAPDSALLVHDEASAAQHLQALQHSWSGGSAVSGGALSWSRAVPDTYWMVDSQVNFCAWALPTVTMCHEDAAALAVLGGVLRNGYLHTAIREKGGAYGAGATHDSSLACFKFYSYRDPRVEGTFADFAASVDWVMNKAAGDDLVEQAVLGIIGGLDRPGSPAGEARQNFHLDKSGRTRELRQQSRDRLLTVSWADVQRVANTYLRGKTGSKAVVAPRGTSAIAEKLGLGVVDY